jgi:hypothetical protein
MRPGGRPADCGMSIEFLGRNSNTIFVSGPTDGGDRPVGPNNMLDAPWNGYREVDPEDDRERVNDAEL